MTKTKKHIGATPFYRTLPAYLIRWSILSLIAGLFTGSASALFLSALEFVTQTRELHSWLIFYLPLAGLLIGLSYYYAGERVTKGTHLLFEEFHRPQKKLPWLMAPLVFAATLLTHLTGGSAGREGTAVQMGATLTDQVAGFLKVARRNRRLLLIAGISGGFASVFGTPAAGTIFAIEVLVLRRLRADLLLPAMMTAFVADAVCTAWGIRHTVYLIPQVPPMNFQNLGMAVLLGISAGVCSLLFVQTSGFFGTVFKKLKYPPLRPVIGGLIIALVVWLSGNTTYLGLGIPVIEQSFTQPAAAYDFALKILFTAFTLAAGFKGGEVTPLFFIGATLGSALSLLMPLPLALLAGMGFVSVFAAASNTPLACTVMAVEMFGMDSAVFMAVACFSAWLFSGRKAIYHTQKLQPAKHFVYSKIRIKKKQS